MDEMANMINAALSGRVKKMVASPWAIISERRKFCSAMGPGSTPAESATPDMRLTETVPLAQLLVRYLQALNEGPKFPKEVIVCYED